MEPKQKSFQSRICSKESSNESKSTAPTPMNQTSVAAPIIPLFRNQEVVVSPHSLNPSRPLVESIPTTLEQNQAPESAPFQSQPRHPMQTRSKRSIFKPKVYATSHLNSLKQPSNSLQTTSEPTCVENALASPMWKKAMNEDFSARPGSKPYLGP